MKLLILDTYYPNFLQDFYSSTPGLVAMDYLSQHRALMSRCFGTSDFFSHNLKELGHDAQEVVVNCAPLQQRWLGENLGERQRRDGWDLLQQMTIVERQVKKLQPDILYVQDVSYFPAHLLDSLRQDGRLIVGQTAYPLDWSFPFEVYDLLISSFPHYVERFRARGIPSEHLALAFEPRVLEKLSNGALNSDTVFVGGLTPAHAAAHDLLERLAERGLLNIWGYGRESLDPSSAIRRHHHGPAWGIEMYEILHGARMALNRHIDVAENCANNMRLFEATGVGTCLVTDMKSNLSDLFDIDTEIVAYTTPLDCLDKILHLVEHERERKKIAAAGQRRTLRDHTHFARMRVLVDILERYLASPRKAGPRRVFSTPRRKGAKSLERARSFIRATPIAPLGRRLLRYAERLSKSQEGVSTAHRVIRPEQVGEGLRSGWQSNLIPVRQRQVVNQELARMYRGDTPAVYSVAADALMETGLQTPSVVEIGCASAYYSEVLPYLLDRRLAYVGIDYSMELILQARFYHPDVAVLVGDAISIPLGDDCCDVCFSPGLIQHVPSYEDAIRESFRIARSWVIMHRTPVFEVRETTHLSKEAYGVPVVELVFNEGKFVELLERLGGELVSVKEVEEYSLARISERVAVKTYLVRKSADLSEKL